MGPPFPRRVTEGGSRGLGSSTPVDADEAGAADGVHEGDGAIPFDAIAGRVLGLQGADAIDLNAAGVEAHDAGVPAEFQGVDGGADRAARADRFVVQDVVVDLDGDAVVPEDHAPELIEI